MFLAGNKGKNSFRPRGPAGLRPAERGPALLLLMFIFARRRGELAPTLKKIRQASRRKNNELLDFRLVLAVWIEYYVYRSASKFDRTSVSYSSGIDFDEWIETVRDLCGPSSSKTSLEYMGIL